MGEEVRGKEEAAHLPGFRYLYRDWRQLHARATPRAKVSAMSHHARALVAAVRGSAAGAPRVPPGEAAAAGMQLDGSLPEGSGTVDEEQCAASASNDSPACSEVLEVVARSSQDCWAFLARPDPGRALLAARERRTESDLADAAAVLQGFAQENFLM
jgi:hypothetical protein